MKAILALLLMLQVAMANVGGGDDFLKPGTGGLDRGSYGEKTRYVLRRAFDGNVVARIQVLPSFTEEWAVGIRKNWLGYFIFSIRAKQPIHLAADRESMIERWVPNSTRGNMDELIARYKKEFPRGFRGIKVIYHEKRITENAAVMIISALAQGVASARTPKVQPVVLDGVWYIVSAKDMNGAMQSANTCSPPSNSYRRRITAMAGDLAAIAEGADIINAAAARAKSVLESAPGTPNQTPEPVPISRVAH